MCQPTSTPIALGFDTSAYTTSVALVAADGTIICDARRVLSVPQGARGLRQSEALFQHIVNLPELMEQIEPALRQHRVLAVSASTTPRNLHDSYMPVFRAGTTVARSIAAALGVPFLPFSHQEGHLWAAFLALKMKPDVEEPFLALHVSGGTTEALHGSLLPNGRLRLTIVGQTSDLTAGKFVDRIGVALGLAFPAGAALEKLASAANPGQQLPVHPAIQGTTISFSGPLTALERLIDTAAPETIAFAAQQVMASGLARWSENVVSSAFARPPRLAFWVGGVAANKSLQAAATASLQRAGVEHVLFAPAAFSTDNALGVAFYAANGQGSVFGQ